MQITDKACLSRGTAGIRGKCLIINLPGSLRAAEENFLSVLNPVIHGIEMLNTADADCAGHYK
jgi:molybdopterin biosynthesis enzyme MoaB